VEGDRIVPLGGTAPGLRAALAGGALPQTGGGAPVALSDVELLPPVPDAPRIFCVGLNYVAHREETGRKPTEHPVIFVRFAQSVAGHGAALAAPPESDTFDYEGELAVVIGRPGRRIAERDALSHVAGYACFMDGTIREYQRHTHQYTPGKNFDDSGGFGPFLVTPDEAGDPNGGLRLETRLNGQVVQEAHTGQMIFTVPVLIAYLSRFTGLRPGDVIATGTPGGVGFKRTPPQFMHPGDVVEVEIERIGCLENRIVRDPGA
jgi:2-keto-4-pentenoate hydratase/2-oxohepta-3-ene-1,7-dioic acid hydratase in catechol pathway